MSYRTMAKPDPSTDSVLAPSFWRERNDLSFDWKAVRSADSEIVSNIKRLVEVWHRDTLKRYPQDYPFILDDLHRATLRRGAYIRVSGDSLHMLNVLVATLDLDGILPDLPPEAAVLQEVDTRAVSGGAKESAVRWLKLTSQVEKIVQAAFKSNARKIDPYLVSRYPLVPAADLLEGLYFRAAKQGDMVFFQSPRMSRALYYLLYE